MGKKQNFKTAEEFAAAREHFFNVSHPDAPIAEDVECLNLIMKREYAEQILRGEKPLEFRAYSPFYIKRLVDPAVSDYIGAHIDDDDVVMFCNDIRQVKKIHFHNYNNSWFLDVECTYNDVFCINKRDIDYLHKEYGVHDFDDDLARYEAMNVEQRPWLFFFACGKVLNTNLDVRDHEELVEICGGEKIIELAPAKESSEISDKKIISFKVRKGDFNDFSDGEMCEFTREITSKNVSQFFILDEKGAIKEINGIPQFKRYDAIQLTCKDDSCTRLIDDADITFLDDEGDNIYYFKLSEEEREDFDYTDGMITYTLGEKFNE